VHQPTTHSLRALSAQPTNPTRVVLILAALVIMVAVLGAAPELLSASTVSVDGPVDSTPTEIDLGASRVANPTTSVTTTEPADQVVRTSGPAAGVPDPRPGDLRFDASGDVLPSDYVAAPAAEIIRDIAYGPDDIHLMDLYLPAETDAPVIVYLHSGGWIAGDRTEVPEFILRFLERGYAIAAVEYRLAPDHPFPAPIHDAKRAVRELKVMGDESDLIDGDRIVLYGTSAGGHIAAFLGATVGEFEPTDLTAAQAEHDSSVAGIVVAVGPTDLVELYGHQNAWARPMSGAHAGCEPCTVEQLELPSPINYVHEDMPPAYWAYGALDPLVDAELQGRLMADAWAEAAGSEFSWFDLVDNSDHNLDQTVMNQRLLEAFVDQAVGR